MTVRWRNLTQPAVTAVSLAVAKQQCRVIDTVAVATQANVTLGTLDTQLLIIVKLAGSFGNQYSVEVLTSGINTSLSVALVDTRLTIRLATNGSGTATSTVSQVISKLFADSACASVFTPTTGVGNGSGLLAAASLTSFVNGLDTGDEDGYIKILIEAAVDVIESRTSRAFITRTARMFLDEWPEEGCITLPVSPVSAVSAVNYYDATTEASTVGTALFQQDIEDQDLPARLVPLAETVLPVLQDKLNAVSVDFTAGYGDSPNDIPPRIRQCVLFLVAHWYAQREPVISGTAILANKVPFTFETTLNSFRLITV